MTKFEVISQNLQKTGFFAKKAIFDFFGQELPIFFKNLLGTFPYIL